MNSFTIRPFRYSDLEAAMELAKAVHAEAPNAFELDPAVLLRQVKSYTRGRMIPFRVLAFLGGIKWGMFVAEANGQLVGFASYQGRNQIMLGNLMVDPAHWRQGIGQALLVARLQDIDRRDFPCAVTTVRLPNEASLGNLRKQGFAIFDQYAIFEASLPFSRVLPKQLRSRPLENRDQQRFQELEEKMRSPEWLRVMDTNWGTYWPSFGSRLQSKISGFETRIQAYEQGGQTIGFLGARIKRGVSKGGLYRPVIAPEHAELLPYMVQDASTWMAQQDKEVVRIALHENYHRWLEKDSWERTESWVKLVKWF